ncbi:hypothetical protein QL285_079829 [Trifolium repens]|nr:hypothetical protein QL285_079829 [Trifolium repens]
MPTQDSINPKSITCYRAKSNHVIISPSNKLKKFLKIKLCSLSEHLARTGEGDTDCNPHLASPGELLTNTRYSSLSERMNFWVSSKNSMSRLAKS